MAAIWTAGQFRFHPRFLVEPGMHRGITSLADAVPIDMLICSRAPPSTMCDDSIWIISGYTTRVEGHEYRASRLGQNEGEEDQELVVIS